MRGLKVTQETINCVVNKCLSHCVCSCVPILTEISNSATDVSDKRRADQVQINTSVPIELCVSAEILWMNCVGYKPPPAPPPLLIDESMIRMTPRIMSSVQQGLERPPDRGQVPGSSAVPR